MRSIEPALAMLISLVLSLAFFFYLGFQNNIEEWADNDGMIIFLFHYWWVFVLILFVAWFIWGRKR